MQGHMREHLPVCRMKQRDRESPTCLSGVPMGSGGSTHSHIHMRCTALGVHGPYLCCPPSLWPFLMCLVEHVAPGHFEVGQPCTNTYSKNVFKFRSNYLLVNSFEFITFGNNYFLMLLHSSSRFRDQILSCSHFTALTGITSRENLAYYYYFKILVNLPT